MKRLQAIFYTVICILLVLSIYTNFEKQDRLDHALEAIEHYEKGVSGCFESNTAWEQAYTICNIKLRDRDCSSEIRQLEHNISMLKSERTFNSIDCSMDSIMDNLDHMMYILDTKEEMKQQEELFNATREALDICKTKI